MKPETSSRELPELRDQRLLRLPKSNVQPYSRSTSETTEGSEDKGEQQGDAIINSAASSGNPNENIPPCTSAEQEKETHKKRSRSRRFLAPNQNYTAVNVKAIGRNSANLAQYINNKEDKRLARTLTIIDKEKTVFSNAITRDEKILLQRSRALAEVVMKSSAGGGGDEFTPCCKSLPLQQVPSLVERTPTIITDASASEKLQRSASEKRGLVHRASSSPIRHLEKPDISYLYSNKDTNKLFSPSKTLKRSRSSVVRTTAPGVEPPKVTTTALKQLKDVNRGSRSAKARLLWVNSVDSIMKRDIKTWHQAYLSTRRRSSPTPKIPLPCKATALPAMMSEFRARRSATSILPCKGSSETTIAEHFSGREIDKGEWITNYINTSCAEHFPMI